MTKCWPIENYGSQAAQTLTPGTRLQVLAVFDSSCYLQTQNGAITCLLDNTHPPGPLHILCRMPPGFAWTSGLQTGMQASATTAGLLLEGQYFCPVQQAPIWRPAHIPRPDGAILRAGLENLYRLIGSSSRFTPSSNGLGHLLRPLLADELMLFSSDNPIISAALPGVAALRHWLHNAAERKISAAVMSLLGLGPGLTPSGDDLLAGLLLGLQVLGWSSAARRLADQLLPAAHERTHPISLAYLQCAAAGEAAAPLHRLLQALCSNNADLAPALSALSRMGHSSGWDSLLGIVLACQAVIPISTTHSH